MRLSSTISCINSIRTRRGRFGRDTPRPTLSRQSYQRGRRVFFAQRNCRAVPRDIPHFPARVVTPARTIPIVLEELSGARKRPMIRPMPTMGRPQQRYDHRLRHLVQRTGGVPVATDLGVPRSTARGWVTELVTGSADLSRRGRDGNSRLLEDPTDLRAELPCSLLTPESAGISCIRSWLSVGRGAAASILATPAERRVPVCRRAAQ